MLWHPLLIVGAVSVVVDEPIWITDVGSRSQLVAIRSRMQDITTGSIYPIAKVSSRTLPVNVGSLNEDEGVSHR